MAPFYLLSLLLRPALCPWRRLQRAPMSPGCWWGSVNAICWRAEGREAGDPSLLLLQVAVGWPCPSSEVPAPGGSSFPQSLFYPKFPVTSPLPWHFCRRGEGCTGCHHPPGSCIVLKSPCTPPTPVWIKPSSVAVCRFLLGPWPITPQTTFHRPQPHHGFSGTLGELQQALNGGGGGGMLSVAAWRMQSLHDVAQCWKPHGTSKLWMLSNYGLYL